MENPELEDEESKAFRIGSALDCLLTSPSRWEQDFKVVDVVRPSGLMQKFIDALPPLLTEDSSLENYQQAYEISGYKKAIAQVVKDLWTKFHLTEYYQSRSALITGQTLLTKDEYEFVVTAKDTILTNPFTSKYFFNHTEDIELIHQFAIYFEYKGIECKALLDGVMIDHKNKTITPFDLKTTSKNVWDFPLAYIEYGYYRQAAFYTIALKWYVEQMKTVLTWSDYEFKDFEFIVIQKSQFKSASPAFIWVTTPNDIKAGIEGGYLEGKEHRKLPGIDSLIEDLHWHKQTNKWDLPRQMYESEGKTTLKVFLDR